MRTLIILLVFITSNFAQNLENGKWVAIRHISNYANGGPKSGESKGWVSNEDFNAIINGTIDKEKFVKLIYVTWTKNKQIETLESINKPWGYSDTEYIKAKNIFKMFPLSEEAVTLIKTKYSLIQPSEAKQDEAKPQ